MAPITFKVGVQLFVVALVALMMAIGITHLNECPINCLIPIYLVSLNLTVGSLDFFIPRNTNAGVVIG